jgi:hypothetical protein
VNRGRFGGSSTALLASSSWEGKITELLAKPDPEFTLYLNAFYNDSAKQFYARTHVKMRSSFSLPLKMEVYLVEDSIINWQLDYAKQPQRNPNYLHQHILRDGFTPIGGSESPGIAPYPAGKISAGSISAGTAARVSRASVSSVSASWIRFSRTVVSRVSASRVNVSRAKIS